MEVIVRNQPSIEIHIEAKVVDSYKTPDSSLSTTSENPVMNKVVTEALNEQGGKLAKLAEEKEDKTNKVTSLSDESTDVQYPSAKCVHDSLSSLAEGIESNGVLIEDLQNMKIDKKNDDYYPKMAVGLADNLAGVDVVDSEINFRRSGGGAISDGVARIESIKGNSVVWNQLRQDDSFVSDTKQGVTLSIEGNAVVMNGTSEGDVAFLVQTAKRATIVANHKYLILGGAQGVANYNFYDKVLIANSGQNNTIFTALASGEVDSQRIYCSTGQTFTNYKIYPCLYDLTKMFGAGNEPTTIEEFYARIPMGVDMNAYNEGEVIHMDVQSIESVGVNAWDEEWELGSISVNTGANVDRSTIIRTKNFIPVIEGRKYYYSCPSTATAWSFCYDDNYNIVEKYLSNNKTGLASTLYGTEFTIPQGVHYIKFYVVDTYGSTYNHDICINLSDPSINGKYFPHIKRVEDLSLIHKYFPDGMKSAGTAHDEIRNNAATGKRESKDALLAVKMKDLDWKGLTSANYTHAFRAALGIGEASGNNVMCIRFVRASNTPLSAWITDSNPYTIAYYNGYIGVNDPAYTDVDAFIASLTDNDILYIERAEPIITELDAEDQFRDLDYKVWNGGTEKSNAEGKSAPLAADITYGFNAIGKIKELEEAIKALQTTVASM